MESHPRSERSRLIVVCSDLQKSLASGWRANQHWVSWALLIVPLFLGLAYGTIFRHLLPYLIISPLTILAAYLIYRSAAARLHRKTHEVEALSNLHLATAEALATAIDRKKNSLPCS